MARPILLVGMMLSGKTTVGRCLADLLQRHFIDTDAEIERASNLTIHEWFKLRGEEAFRRAEQEQILRLVAPSADAVIAVGGGAFEDRSSRHHCLKHAFVVYLDSSIETLTQRYTGHTGRPLLDSTVDPGAALREILARREENYKKAHFVISVTRQSPMELARIIAKTYGQTNRC